MNRQALVIGIALLGLAVSMSFWKPATDVVDEPTASYIVQGASLEEVTAVVSAAGGVITHELGVISAVAAELTARQVEDLRRHRDVRRVYDNGTLL